MMKKRTWLPGFISPFHSSLPLWGKPGKMNDSAGSWAEMPEPRGVCSSELSAFLIQFLDLSRKSTFVSVCGRLYMCHILSTSAPETLALNWLNAGETECNPFKGPGTTQKCPFFLFQLHHDDIYTKWGNIITFFENTDSPALCHKMKLTQFNYIQRMVRFIFMVFQDHSGLHPAPGDHPVGPTCWHVSFAATPKESQLWSSIPLLFIYHSNSYQGQLVHFNCLEQS